MASLRSSGKDKPTPSIKKENFSLVNEVEVKGKAPFHINSTDFIISPLKSAASLYIVSIHLGVDNPKKVADIKAGDYTKVTGNVPNTRMYIDTNETFYIKF